ncbi:MULTISPECIES: hypothetical protein [Williamsia]|uniref:hypothetical protein n=1 Tax=Williamsia TaxID=85043 RepID=UPI0003D358B3|nr:MULTISPECIES: hypothetical protein [Williamsia]ETD33367.1 hypothetical protein W823_09635 [Williamsia sp. D3]PVY30229.1 hypothetical protein C7458_105476 [Williamsia marianensis]PZT97925.1 MAG: hypothetical protein DI630_20685 [Gordonia sp. (in: high G+C Gram-positive bacteria)]
MTTEKDPPAAEPAHSVDPGQIEPTRIGHQRHPARLRIVGGDLVVLLALTAIAGLAIGLVTLIEHLG